ncbi:MAG: Hemolysin-type calcium-binding region [Ramlibacter sp.]|jgi:Ca2+-binding RTX toxin-like protein|nr:Hemolysin-type calcium-binding region [Ramlibacter sp.]
MDFSFSSLADGQHVAFDAAADRLMFAAAVNAGLVKLNQVGTAVTATYLAKTVFLDDTTLAELRIDALNFANGGLVALGDGEVGQLADWYGQNIDLSTATASNQLQGLGGADYLQGGSGNDLLVGNTAVTPFNHISRVGQTGAPTATFDPTLSADGNFVGFRGGWTSFGSVNNNATDVLVKDLLNNTVSNEHKSATGTLGNSGSGAPVVSADGRSLVFLSASSNLVEGSQPVSSYSIYLASIDGPGIDLVSTGTGGVLATDGSSVNPDISGNGRWVVFESTTSNWAAGGSTSTSDIFLKDLNNGNLTRISTSTTGGDGNGDSEDVQISNDGRLVVFESAASNLTVGDTNGRTDVFVWDRVGGDITNLSDLMVGRDMANAVLNPDVAYDAGWGGVIVFETAKELVDADDNNTTDVYAYNIFDETFSLVSSKANGAGVALSSGNASISGDGRFVVFTSFSDSLVAGDNNGFADVFVKDLFTGQIALVSRTAGGGSANQSSDMGQISLGGDWIVFESSASNLAGTDDNGGLSDVFRVSNPFLRDTLEGGGGNDTYVINRDDLIIEAAGGGTDLVQSSITYRLVANVEDLELTGTAKLNGTGNTGNNGMTGNSGNNKLSGLGGNDFLSGGQGNDILVGGTGRDILLGGGGNDTFDFNALSELGLGTARDTIRGWDGGDVIDLRTIDANRTLAGDQAFTFRGSNAFTASGQVRYENGVLQFNTDADAAADFEIVITGTPPASLVVGNDLLL